MRYFELREMSYSEAKQIWLRHGVDPGKITQADLAGARKRLMKKVHPDAGGSDKDAQLVNAAYDVLKKGETASSSSDGGYWQERPRRQRNPWYSPGENERRDQSKEDSDATWAWAGHSGGAGPSARIYRQDYTDVNYIKKHMWELSGKSREEWTIWGFDGNFTRGVTTVYGSSKIFAQMAQAMITWQTKGGNPYECRAVLVESKEPYRSKQYQDEDSDQQNTMLVIWADGVFYDKDPIPITYETFNRNPGNDRSFNHRLRKLIDDLHENQGRQHEQSSMHPPGGAEGASETFETGAYVVHPKHGVGRIINPEIRKGMIRAAFKKDGTMHSGNVKAASLRKASRQEQWQFEHGD